MFLNYIPCIEELNLSGTLTYITTSLHIIILTHHIQLRNQYDRHIHRTGGFIFYDFLLIVIYLVVFFFTQSRLKRMKKDNQAFFPLILISEFKVKHVHVKRNISWVSLSISLLHQWNNIRYQIRKKNTHDSERSKIQQFSTIIDIIFQVANARLCAFSRLLFYWKGSVYKLMYKEMAIFMVLYTILSLVYRFALHESAKR